MVVKDKLKLDLACGQSKKGEEWIGVDVADLPGVDLVHDLQKYPWPFEDESVDEIHCSHYIEHIPHDDLRSLLEQSDSFEEFKKKATTEKLDGVIKFINEIYRILKPGAKATIIAPYYMSTRAFGDPTHTRYFGDSSLYYFNEEWRKKNRLEHYGIIADFNMKYSYFVDNEITLKSEPVRTKAFKHDWNTINDIIVELEKRKE